MPNILQYLDGVSLTDDRFVGTVAFNSENLSLPDGSKMALGIDGAHWVLVYQKQRGAIFQMFEYEMFTKYINVDGRPGNEADYHNFRNLVKYFFANAKIDDLVTILPPEA